MLSYAMPVCVRITEIALATIVLAWWKRKKEVEQMALQRLADLMPSSNCLV